MQVNGEQDVIRSLTHQIHTFRVANGETNKQKTAERPSFQSRNEREKKIIGIDGQFNRQVPNGISPSLPSSFSNAVQFLALFYDAAACHLLQNIFICFQYQIDQIE